MYSLSHQLRASLTAPLKYQNWFEICTALWKQQPIQRVQLLHPQLDLAAPTDVPLLDLINEVIYHEEYGQVIKISAGDVVVDIGASTGDFTLWATQFSPKCIVAVEPMPEIVKYLRQNIKRNHAKHIKIEAAGIAHKTGSMQLFLNEMGAGHSMLRSSNKKRKQRAVTVATITLDGLCKKYALDHIDYLKIDCEGSEGMIFKQATKQKQWWQKVQKIALEFHDHLSPLNHIELETVLKNLGYSTQLVWDKRGTIGYIFCWRGAL